MDCVACRSFLFSETAAAAGMGWGTLMVVPAALGTLVAQDFFFFFFLKNS